MLTVSVPDGDVERVYFYELLYRAEPRPDLAREYFEVYRPVDEGPPRPAGVRERDPAGRRVDDGAASYAEIAAAAPLRASVRGAFGPGFPPIFPSRVSPIWDMTTLSACGIWWIKLSFHRLRCIAVADPVANNGGLRGRSGKSARAPRLVVAIRRHPTAWLDGSGPARNRGRAEPSCWK